jgi:putative membrane protein insertion efficiency factor
VNAAQYILIFLVRVYQWTLSPLKTALFGPLGGCRFDPSCSHYAAEAVRTHGAWRGGWLAVRRLGRCHPWGGCGDDPVPARSAGGGKHHAWEAVSGRHC